MDILNASATQTDSDSGKSEWVINNNKGEELYRLDKTLNERQVMEAIHMARFFSEEAMKMGMDISNNKHSIEIEGIMTRGQAQVDVLNERISVVSTELLKQMEAEEI